MKPIILMAVFLFSSSTFAVWYKGNTHAHTILSGHGDATPLEVGQWYHDHGYNFLVLSEHNNFIDPETVKLKDKREDFIFVPGVEVTGAKHIHTTALNVRQVIPFKTTSSIPSDILREHVRSIQAAGGEAISNHPNWEWALTAANLLKVTELKLFELYNGHPHVKVGGDDKHPSTEEIWDHMLANGKRIFAVSSDDAHHFHDISHEQSNPGRGWIMVNSNSLNPASIVRAMIKGNFYASNGVVLSDVKRGPEEYEIMIDLEATVRTINSGRHLLGDKAGRRPGLRVEFIGFNGKVLHIEDKFDLTSAVVKASFMDKMSPYIRAKIIYTVSGEHGNASYYAWTQPWWK